MPKLYEYKDRDGFYIKTRIKGRMVTYQLTEAGVDKLTEDNYGHLDDIPFSLLHRFRELGLIYTRNSGPSDILDDDDRFPSGNSEDDIQTVELSEEELDRVEETFRLSRDEAEPEYDTQVILAPLVVKEKPNEKSSRKQKRQFKKPAKNINKKQSAIKGRRRKEHVTFKNPMPYDFAHLVDAFDDVKMKKPQSTETDITLKSNPSDNGDYYWLEPIMKILIALSLVFIFIYLFTNK